MLDGATASWVLPVIFGESMCLAQGHGLTRASLKLSRPKLKVGNVGTKTGIQIILNSKLSVLLYR